LWALGVLLNRDGWFNVLQEIGLLANYYFFCMFIIGYNLTNIFHLSSKY